MRNSSLLKWAQTGSGKNSGGCSGSSTGNGTATATTNGGSIGGGGTTNGGKDGNRCWIHPPDALQRGHIAYLVKFLGNTEVGQAKGIVVVKEAIRKLKFSQQLRKAEGSKTPKVELTVSIDGVAIQEPKSKRILHQYPLHRISYCADDKGEKRFFSFIAKEADSEAHSCFVFVSDKLAEEITLTIGQAFDLAYRRFVETSGRDLEAQRRLMLLQQRTVRLEAENRALRRRLEDVARLAPQSEVDAYLSREGIQDLLTVDLPGNPANSSSPGNSSLESANSSSNAFDFVNLTQTSSPTLVESSNLVNLSVTPSAGLTNVVPSNSSITSSGNSTNGMSVPPVPPRAFEADARSFLERGCLSSEPRSAPRANSPSVGTRLEGLLLDELDTDDDFDPRAFESTNGSSTPNNTSGSIEQENDLYNYSKVSAPRLAPPPKMSRDSRRTQPQNGSTIFSTENPFKEDLFGSTPFNPTVTSAPTKIASQTITPAPATADPFGMGEFSGGQESRYFENALGLLDKRILEMKDGFSRGLSFGNEDFSIESLDPLRN